MKNKNTKRGARFYVTIVVGVIIILATLLTLIEYIINQKVPHPEYLVLIFMVVGFLAGYFVHNLLHEMGHMLFAKMSGAKIYGVSFLGMVINGKESKKRFYFDIKSGVAGWTSFIPKKPNGAPKSLVLSLLGGLLGSLISIVGVFVGLYFARQYQNSILVYILTTALCSNFYLILLNFFTHMPGTDGNLLAVKHGVHSNEFYDSLVKLEYQSHFLNEVSLKEVQNLMCKDILPQNFFTVYDVQKSLQMGNLVGAEKLCDDAINGRKSTDNGLIDLLIEDLFIAIVQENDQKIQILYKKLEGSLLEQDSLSSLRTAIFYRMYNGERDWALRLKKTYEKTLDECPLKGLQKTEREIFQNYFKNQAKIS